MVVLFIRLPIVALIILCCGHMAAAQQNALVLKDDSNDPCSRFKMRILVPSGESGNYKLRMQKPSSDIDPKIIWNPCPPDGSLEARLMIQPAPDFRGKFFVNPPAGALPLPSMLNEQQDRLRHMELQLPPVMEMMRGRRQ